VPYNNENKGIDLAARQAGPPSGAWPRLASWLGSKFAAAPRRVPVTPAAGGQGMPPALVEPRIKKSPGGQSWPSFMTRAAPAREQKLASLDRRLATTDVLSLRSAANTKALVRQLVSASPDIGASVNAYTRLIVTKGYKALARNQDGTPNAGATQSLQVLLTRIDYMAGYADGFSGVTPLHGVAEALVKELRIEGSCAMELVLDKSLMPERLRPISTSQITFVDDGSTKAPYPIQTVGGVEINLDFPTFFYEALDQDLLQAYSDSPMEGAVQATLADAEFSNDVRRIIKRSLHPRLTATIDGQEYLKTLPPEVLNNTDELDAHRNQLIQAIQSQVSGLAPEDALVSFDTLKFSYMGRGNESLSREYDTLQNINNAKVASGAKAPGAVLGHVSGSQNIASTESMLFVKYAQGVQIKVNSILSRALTLAVRLLGWDCYVEFEFDRIDLRPDSELEAFHSMKQSRILDLLSLGFLTDEEAAIELMGRLPPAGAPKLSGTFFRAQAGASGAPPAGGNLYSNTSALNQTLTPATPQQPKSAKPRGTGTN